MFSLTERSRLGGLLEKRGQRKARLSSCTAEPMSFIGSVQRLLIREVLIGSSLKHLNTSHLTHDRLPRCCRYNTVFTGNKQLQDPS